MRFEWDKKCFPDIRATLKKYHDKGLHICAWINPYIAQGTAFFKEGAANGYLLQRADGKGVWQTDNWQAGMGLVDFTNPDAVKWYTDKLRTVLDCGVDCFKTDFGERESRLTLFTTTEAIRRQCTTTIHTCTTRQYSAC